MMIQGKFYCSIGKLGNRSVKAKKEEKVTYHRRHPAIQTLMAQGEMCTLVVDKTVGAQAFSRLLGTLPALLKASNVGCFLDISWKGRWVTFLFLFGLLRLLLRVFFVFFVNVDSRRNTELNKPRLEGTIQKNTVVGSRYKRVARFANNTGNGE